MTYFGKLSGLDCGRYQDVGSVTLELMRN